MSWIRMADAGCGKRDSRDGGFPEKHDSDASRESCSTRTCLIKKIFKADPLLYLYPLWRQQWLAQEYLCSVPKLQYREET
jgi:hypothetical protein